LVNIKNNFIRLLFFNNPARAGRGLAKTGFGLGAEIGVRRSGNRSEMLETVRDLRIETGFQEGQELVSNAVAAELGVFIGAILAPAQLVEAGIGLELRSGKGQEWSLNRVPERGNAG
jgi:hypothetical protein